MRARVCLCMCVLVQRINILRVTHLADCENNYIRWPSMHKLYTNMSHKSMLYV